MTALLMNHTDCRQLALRSRFSVNRPAISLAQLPAFGVALAILGGGREKKEDTIDHARRTLDFTNASAIASKKANPWPRLATMLILGVSTLRL